MGASRRQKTVPVKPDAGMTTLLELADAQFRRVRTGDTDRCGSHTARDCLKCGLGIFLWKYESMLKFDEGCGPDELLRTNLEALLGVTEPPSDTTLRRRLDAVEPKCVHRVLRTTFGWMRERRLLDAYRVDGRVPVAVDGTGYHTSTKVRCDHCLTRQRRDGKTHYLHAMLAAAVVHPDLSASLPVIAEPIVRQDGKVKQDCEQAAFERLLPRLCAEHRGTKFLILGDALYATEPVVTALRAEDARFVLTLRETRHAAIQQRLDEADPPAVPAPSATADEPERIYRWLADTPLNASAGDACQVTIVEQVETVKDKVAVWTWATDLPVTTADEARRVALLGRGRWHIENHVFRTLKSQDGYHFGHNYGHGDRHLSTLMMLLMLVAFLFDQIAALVCQQYQAARAHARANRALWSSQRVVLRLFPVQSWEDFYGILAPTAVWPGAP